MYKIITKLSLVTLLLCLFSLSLNAGIIRVAVASNVSYAITELKNSFQLQYPNTEVQIILGSSGKLTHQIINGAPFDVFLSADMLYPETLYKESLALLKPRVYAKGALVLLSTEEQDFSLGMSLLKEKHIKKIAIASKNAPYGMAAFEVLHNTKLSKIVKHKLVYGESVSQTLSYILRAADIGFVAKSTLYTAQLSKFKDSKHSIEVSQELYKPITQGIVILKHASKNSEALAFYEFMLSPRAQKILQKYGYVI